MTDEQQETDHADTACCVCGRACPGIVCCSSTSTEDETGADGGKVRHEDAICLRCCTCPSATRFRLKEGNDKREAMTASVRAICDAECSDLRMVSMRTLRGAPEAIAESLYANGMSTAEVATVAINAVERAKGLSDRFKPTR